MLLHRKKNEKIKIRRKESEESFFRLKKKSHQIPFVYGRVNETMKNEVLLPIEINIPRRFFSEGNSNILHREKMLSFNV